MKNLYLIRLKLLFLLFILSYVHTQAQGNTYRIFFKDKGINDFSPGSYDYENTLNSLSKRAIERRLKVLPPEMMISIEDVELFPEYLSAIENLGVLIVAKVKWENYCVGVVNDEGIIEDISELSFVKHIQATSSEFIPLSEVESEIINSNSTVSLLSKISNQQSDSLDNPYGAILPVASMMKVPEVHSLGISGKGVFVGFLDSGFRIKGISPFDNLDIVAEYDFIGRDSVTSNQQFDRPNQDHHGTQVLAIAAARKDGFYIGIAPSSSVALAKTESLQYERKIEEDWFYQGVEWLESLGVDIISASLGYKKFDSTETSYEFGDMTGNKAITSRAVNAAARRGVLFNVAAGNNGPEPQTIITPADADSVIAIASVNSNGEVSKFSSRGSDALDRIRPHLAARGSFVRVINPENPDTLVISNGTSLATPAITGAASLVLSAFPEIKPSQVKHILFSNASNFPEPDNDIGYGIPNIYDAMLSYDIVISDMISYPIEDNQRVIFKISYKEKISEAYIKFKESKDGYEIERELAYAGDGFYYTDFRNKLFIGDTIYVAIYAKAIDEKSRRKPYKDNEYFKVIKNSKQDVFSLNPDNFPVSVDLADENKSNTYVYPSIVSPGAEFVRVISNDRSKEVLKIEVIDLMGRIKYQQLMKNPQIGGVECLIPVSDYNKGIYTVRLTLQKGIEIIKFIVI